MNNLEDTFSDLASFSLANTIDENICNVSEVSKNGDNTYLIYFGVGLLICIVSFFIYKFYLNKKKVSFSDDDSYEINNNCYNDMCPV
jgi:hypothetical protein